MEKMCIYFQHNDFDDNHLLYCVERYVRVEIEGAAIDYFGKEVGSEIVAYKATDAVAVTELQVEMEMPSASSNKNEGIAQLCAEGYSVDND